MAGRQQPQQGRGCRWRRLHRHRPSHRLVGGQELARIADLKERDGIGYCNINKCCTVVCPESITITDNAIIPLKERVADRFCDPIKRLLRVFG